MYNLRENTALNFIVSRKIYESRQQHFEQTQFHVYHVDKVSFIYNYSNDLHYILLYVIYEILYFAENIAYENGKLHYYLLREAHLAHGATLFVSNQILKNMFQYRLSSYYLKSIPGLFKEINSFINICTLAMRHFALVSNAQDKHLFYG